MWFHDLKHHEARDCEVTAEALCRLNEPIVLAVVDDDDPQCDRFQLFLTPREAGTLLTQLAQAIRHFKNYHTHGGTNAHHALSSVER